MTAHVGKWGNSLAVRLPRHLAAKFGVKEGDPIDDATLEAMLAAAQAAAIQARRDAAMKRIEERAFELPPDWKFDRDEANWRPAMDRW